MYIKSIVLDGFKSYRNKVELKEFDADFNAITDLNGTNKSDILAAIHFVLGTTKIPNAEGFQELIYKNGKAEITKASVTITFDNSDLCQRPIGYDIPVIVITREVEKGGKHRYLVNGDIVPNSSVISLFCSVPMNVNIPHFFITLATITKALDMTQHELLSVVDDIAATGMYEAMRRPLDDKEDKLAEFNNIINLEILPTLQELSFKSDQCVEYQGVLEEIEMIKKLHIASKFVAVAKKSKEKHAKVSEMANSIKPHKINKKKLQKRVSKIDEEITQLNSVVKQLLASDASLLSVEMRLHMQTSSLRKMKRLREDAKLHHVQMEKRLREDTSLPPAKLAEGLRDNDALLRAKERELEQIEDVLLDSWQLKTITSRTAEIGRLLAEKERHCIAISIINKEIMKLEHKDKNLRADALCSQHEFAGLVAQYPWIVLEHMSFGVAGGPYDFAAHQASMTDQHMEQLKKRRDKLAKGLEVEAPLLLIDLTKKYEDMMRVKNAVEEGHAKTVSTLETVNETKQDYLTWMCENINRDFESIFSSLLPGAMVRLTPIAGLSVLDGLELNVGLNGTWVDSLEELPEGQRTLVGLSLELLMQLFRPAPLCILSGVDTVLDASLTKHFGKMLRRHFRYLQFIVVSQTDGIFNNADVQFKTSFVNGVATVSRTVCQQKE